MTCQKLWQWKFVWRNMENKLKYAIEYARKIICESKKDRLELVKKGRPSSLDAELFYSKGYCDTNAALVLLVEALDEQDNAETLQAMKDSRSGENLTEYPNLKDGIEDCIGDHSKQVLDMIETKSSLPWRLVKEGDLGSFDDDGLVRGNGKVVRSKDSYGRAPYDMEYCSFMDLITAIESILSNQVKLGERIKKLEEKCS